MNLNQIMTQFNISRLNFGHLGLFAILSFLNLINSSTSFEYFKEQPSFLTPCKIYQPGFTACSTENTQKLMTAVGKGIPEVKAVIGDIDPIKLKEINFRQDNTEAASLRADLTDLTATGINDLVIKESKVSKKDFSWLTKIFIPKFKLEGHYKMDGRILLLPLNGEGHFVIEIDGMDLLMRTKTQLIEKGGFTFYNITSVKVDLEISKLHTQFDDLFGGNNKEVERSTNESFNKNWKEFFEALRPLINETVERVLYDILHPVFLLIPANFMVEDIPSPEKLYGNKQ
ncbi:circadian clock-controlled protein daywake-like [Cochliomyia hominivorax]